MRNVISSRCTLEPQVAAHAQEMFAVLSDPAIYEFENAPPESEEWLRKRYERLETRCSQDGTQKYLNWVVRLPSGRLAGYVQATVLPERISYVAYEFNSQHWRQGLGSDALQAMLRELHEQYDVTAFIAVLKARNYRSDGLLRKLGFVRASKEQEAQYRDEPDEMVLVKQHPGGENAA
ncbi:acetyltransferase, ribosomal protein N-acetylase [Burkholderiales bacterium JOSHI_001]|nr:acetyltransferase, ribosomal protein N-acetylase [Burkholderiales bacterium JOSHI_001]